MTDFEQGKQFSRLEQRIEFIEEQLFKIIKELHPEKRQEQQR